MISAARRWGWGKDGGHDNRHDGAHPGTVGHLGPLHLGWRRTRDGQQRGLKGGQQQIGGPRRRGSQAVGGGRRVQAENGARDEALLHATTATIAVDALAGREMICGHGHLLRMSERVPPSGQKRACDKGAGQLSRVARHPSSAVGHRVHPLPPGRNSLSTISSRFLRPYPNLMWIGRHAVTMIHSFGALNGHTVGRVPGDMCPGPQRRPQSRASTATNRPRLFPPTTVDLTRMARCPGDATVTLACRSGGRADLYAGFCPCRRQGATIHLGSTLPHSSSGLPGSSGGQPSNASCLTLLRVGFA